MFKRIVSSLSLSPSAAGELAFYARRLKQEKVTRSFSAIAAVLVFGLQFATIIAPPTPSNAASPNDIIYGGIVSKADLLNRYDGSDELKALFTRFGIARADLDRGTQTTVKSSDTSLKSIGRVRHWADDEVIDSGRGTYYGRVLHKWDSGASSTYTVLAGTRSSDGGYYAVMFKCGNIIYRNLPPVATPKPTPAPTPVITPVPVTPVPVTIAPSPRTVRTPTPTPTPKSATPTPKAPTPAPTPVASVVCTKLEGSVATGIAPVKVAFTGSGTATGQTISEYQFAFGDGTTQNGPAATATHQYASPGTYTATLAVKGSTGAVSTGVPACSYTVSVTATPASFSKSKAAFNATKNVDATSTPADAGDRIIYRLTTTNNGGTAASYSVVEHVSDITEYADVTARGGADLDTATQVLAWPTAIITPGASLTQSFEVTVKQLIPDTPTGSSDRYSYDLRMDNVYGNEVQVKVQPPLPKQVETTVSELPHTGPGTSTAIILIITFLTLFFYFRNRQLAAEVRLLRHDFTQGGM